MRSIKTKILLFSFFMIFIVSFSLASIAYINYRQMFIEEMEHVLVVQAEESSEHIISMLEEHVVTLQEVAQHDEIKSFNIDRQLQFISTQVLHNYFEVAVVTVDGLAHYTSGEKIDLSDREYIQEAFKGRQSFSDIITSRKTGNKVIMVAVPVFDNEGIVRNVIIGRSSSSFLCDLVSDRGYGTNGYAFMMNKEGTFVAHIRKELVVKSVNIYDVKSEDELSSDNELYTSFNRFFEDSLLSDSGSGDYFIDNEKVIIGYTWIPNSNWIIYVGAYEEELLQPLDRINNLFFVLVILFIVSSLLGSWLLAKRFADPIIDLSLAFDKASQGDLTVRAEMHRRDEIGRAGDSFNIMMNQLKSLTYYDPLTSLPNLNVFSDELDSLLKGRSMIDPLIIVMISMDNFTGINQIYGYRNGDILLRLISERIKETIPKSCKLFKGKGDEFMVLCETIEISEVKDSLDRFIAIIQEEYEVNNRKISVKLSMGIATYPESGREKDRLMTHVTYAKQQAKLNGGSRYEIYNPKKHQMEKQLISIEEDVQEAILNNQFYMVYQPLFDIKTGELVDIEALIRWNHPKKGEILPDQFIEVCERSGLILDLDQWVFRTVCKQQKEWNEQYIISINISAKSFERRDFVQFITDTLQEFDLNPNNIQLELTERVIMEDIEENIKKMRELKSLGIRIALDDFGIGYSSLNYIVRLPLDTIKIDRSFIQNLAQGEEEKAIVATIISMGRTLQMKVIAEGIENESELDFLRENGCHIGQGYYYSKPINKEDLEEKYS